MQFTTPAEQFKSCGDVLVRAQAIERIIVEAVHLSEGIRVLPTMVNLIKIRPKFKLLQGEMKTWKFNLDMYLLAPPGTMVDLSFALMIRRYKALANLVICYEKLVKQIILKEAKMQILLRDLMVLQRRQLVILQLKKTLETLYQQSTNHR